MTHTITEQPEALALADLRHLYQQMVGGGVRDSLQARRIAEGILSRAIRKLEASQAQRVPLSDAQIEQAMEWCDVCEGDHVLGAFSAGVRHVEKLYGITQEKP